MFDSASMNGAELHVLVTTSKWNTSFLYSSLYISLAPTARDADILVPLITLHAYSENSTSHLFVLTFLFVTRTNAAQLRVTP